MEIWTPFSYGLRKLIEENKIDELLGMSTVDLAEIVVDFLSLVRKVRAK